MDLQRFPLFVLLFHSRNVCVRPGFSHMLPSRSFVALHFYICDLLCMDFCKRYRIYVCIGGGHGVGVLVQNHLMKRVFSSLYCFCSFVKPAGTICMDLFLGTYIGLQPCYKYQ